MSIINKIHDSMHEPPEFLTVRKNAETWFKKLEMPSPNLESWKYTKLNLELSKLIFGTQKTRFQNTKGVNIFSSHKGEHGPVPKTPMMKLFDYTQDKLAAMHAAYYNNLMVIHVPQNIHVKKPLWNTITTEKDIVQNHIIIILEENAYLNYVEEHVSSDEPALRNDVVEIYLNSNSKLDYHFVQNWNRNILGFSNMVASLGKNCSLNWYCAQFGGKLSRVNVLTKLAEPGAESSFNGVFFGSDDQHFDLSADAHHIAQNTSSNILVKGALTGLSSSVFRGMIKIDKTAQKTSSYVSEHVLILSKNALANSIPSLKIDAHDVRAGHGATIGKINDEELFYLLSRGLDQKSAERLIITGFLTEVLNKFKVMSLVKQGEQYVQSH